MDAGNAWCGLVEPWWECTDFSWPGTCPGRSGVVFNRAPWKLDPSPRDPGVVADLLPPSFAAGSAAAPYVERVVRQTAGRLRECYARGFREDATLAGTVRVRLVIDANGDVASAADAGSDLHPYDARVVQCVLGVFERLELPVKPVGTVSLVYSLELRPDDHAVRPAGHDSVP